MMRSGLYRGSVMHHRVRPKRHQLRYDVFYLLIDLDELPTFRLQMLGVERAGPLSFRAKDHGDGSGDLKEWVVREVRTAGISDEITGIRLLCFPRVFGFVFNPISVYFCNDPTGAVVAVLYEVNNTFGGRHTYVLPAEPTNDRVSHGCSKVLYVSPFNDVSGDYRFAMRLPGEKIGLSIDQHDGQGRVLRASFAGRRYPLDDRNLFKVLVLYPFLTLKVVAGIHWEALKLWLKGVPLHKRPRFADTLAKRPDMRGDTHGGIVGETGV